VLVDYAPALIKDKLQVEIEEFKTTVPYVEKQLLFRLPKDQRWHASEYEGALTRSRRTVEEEGMRWRSELASAAVMIPMPGQLAAFAPSIEAIQLLQEMKRFVTQQFMTKRARLEGRLYGIDLSARPREWVRRFQAEFQRVAPDVQVELAAEMYATWAYNDAERELYRRYDGHPAVLQAVLEWLKESWNPPAEAGADDTDGTSFLTGRHTIQWVIDGWALLDKAGADL